MGAPSYLASFISHFYSTVLMSTAIDTVIYVCAGGGGSYRSHMNGDVHVEQCLQQYCIMKQLESTLPYMQLIFLCAFQICV